MSSRRIYDPVDQMVLLFGGSMYDDGYTLYNDLWSYRYETNTWTEIETTSWRQVDSEVRPPSRCCSIVVYDPVNDVILIFGGMANQVYMDDLWALDSAGQWSQLTGGAGPVEPVEENGIPGYPMLSILLGFAMISGIGLGKRLVKHG